MNPCGVALTWTLVWVACALLFDGLLWLYLYLTTTPFIAEEKAVGFSHWLPD